MITPDPSESEQLEHLAQELAAAAAKHTSLRLVGADGDAVEVSASALAALRAAVDAMAAGEPVAVLTQARELTTQQAADLLRVSRPHLVALLDRGVLPSRRVGTHRRVRVEDLVAYREQRRRERADALDMLVRLSERTEGGYR